MPTKLTKAQETRADDEIAREIRRKTKVDFEIPVDRVMVTVTGGSVNLEGDALLPEGGRRALRQRSQRGTEVTNRLAITPNGS